MKYLLIGGSGFIGTNLSRFLIQKGHEVSIADNNSFHQDSNLEDLRESCKFYGVDVLDSVELKKLVQKAQPDYIFHMAGVVGIENYLKSPELVVETNIIGVKNVINICEEFDIPMLFTSTSEVLGKNNNNPWKEDADRLYGSATVDRWVYGVSKGIAEQIINIHARENALKATIVRFFNIYGPGQSRGL